MVKKTLFFLLLSHCAISQDSTLTSKEERVSAREKKAQLNNRYYVAGICGTQTGVQDQRMSSLVFGGVGGGLDLQMVAYSDRSYRDLQLRAFYNPVSTSIAPGAVMHATKSDLNYSYLWRLKKTSAHKIYLGGSVNSMGNVRYFPPLVNNSVGVDISLGLSPVMVWVKEKIFKRNLLLQVKGGFNMLTFSLRYPQFVYAGREYQIKTVGQFNRLFFEIGLSPQFKYSKENRYYFAYVFDAYAFSSSIDGNKIRTYMNGIKFAYWLKTK